MLQSLGGKCGEPHTHLLNIESRLAFPAYYANVSDGKVLFGAGVSHKLTPRWHYIYTTNKQYTRQR